MRKLLLFTISFFAFTFVLNADGIKEPVTFTLVENFYADVEKKYENDTTVFYYTNNLLSMDLTDDELKSIISQKPGNGSSRLTYYETLKIDVQAVSGTTFESLGGKSKLYRANGGGSWVSEITHNQEIQETAKIYNLNNAFWPYGFKLQYRPNISASFTGTAPSGKDLSNKTLEEQLATVLELDLDANEDAVIEQYNTLWRFNPLPEGYTYLLRFDFLDNKEISPILKEDTTDEYLTSSLKNMGTRYVAIMYDRTEDSTTFLETDNKTGNKTSLKILLIVIILLASTIIVFRKIKV